MVTGLARHDDVTIAYERLGPADGEPLLLVMGLGMQLLSWPDEFCAMLVERGFSVVRFDNRDAGQSTHSSHAGPPSLLQILARPRAVAPYRLADMADDAAAVLDAVGWPRARGRRLAGRDDRPDPRDRGTPTGCAPSPPSCRHRHRGSAAPGRVPSPPSARPARPRRGSASAWSGCSG